MSSRWPTPSTDDRLPRVWVLTDDKAGHTTQSFGLADALGWPCERKDLHFNAKAKRSGRRLGASIESVDLTLSSPLEPPWPDLVIATGKRAAPVARWIGRQSHGRTRLVQLGRKGGNVAEEFDLTVTCTHFRQPPHPSREEILAPLTAVTPARLAEARRRWAGLFGSRPRPWVALLVGGRSASHDIDATTARRMAREVAAATTAAGGALHIVTSPRTGREALAGLKDSLVGSASVYEWKRDDPENPYFGCLAVADVLVVTGDSESMIAEAVAAGKPTYIYDAPVRRSHAFKPRNIIRSWVQSHAAPGPAMQRTPLERWCTRLIERGLVQPLRDLNAMHAGLYSAGLARPFAQPIETGWQRAWTEADRVAARVAALVGVAPIPRAAGGDA
ncbi:MAG: mitochondrial fission ELM1 family protein [Candidatus Binatia bacterium]